MTDTLPAIETDSLSFAYGRESVLHDVSLSVPAGCIYGYLGRNGAGKTTTIKLVLGLLNVRAGRVRVLGLDPERDRLALLQRIGALIEAPSLYDHLSGWENLRLTALLRGIPERRMRETLDLVGLTTQAGKRVGAYSQGMRQRLGVALALLPDPDLLVLDEPTNGLDPNGIREMRALFTRLNREAGKTLFISSHLLSEVEKTCTRIGIIESGRLIFEDEIESFRRVGTSSVVMRVSDAPAAGRVLAGAGYQPRVEDGSQEVRYTFRDDGDTARRIRILVEAGVEVYAVESRRMDLETFFLERIQEEAPA